MLKEEDELIDLIRDLVAKPRDMMAALSVREAIAMVQSMMDAYRAATSDEERDASQLRRYAPSISCVFLALDLQSALEWYDAQVHLTSRRFVPPTFKEIRHLINRATVVAAAPEVSLVTFDADDTIYEDGGTITAGSPMCSIIEGLLTNGVTVSLVTAAGYPGAVERYEQRLCGLLAHFRAAGLSQAQLARFLVMGGECNYLHRVRDTPAPEPYGLELIPGREWKDGRGVRWAHDDVAALLDTAEACLRETAALLGLSIRIIRKERAVGMISQSAQRMSYEVLEETALAVQEALRGSPVPHCAFNGGNDVWVDVGNKALGIKALQTYVSRCGLQERHAGAPVLGHNCLHVGDRFTRTGNDTRARDVCSTLWVSDPRETLAFMGQLVGLLSGSSSSEDAAGLAGAAGEAPTGAAE